MSETKAAYAERAILSIKSFLHRYLEDYGYKYVHKLPQFGTTSNSRKKNSIELNFFSNDSKIVLCPFCTANLYEITGNQNIKLLIELASQSMNCHSERVTSPNLSKFF